MCDMVLCVCMCVFVCVCVCVCVCVLESLSQLLNNAIVDFVYLLVYT